MSNKINPKRREPTAAAAGAGATGVAPNTSTSTGSSSAGNTSSANTSSSSSSSLSSAGGGDAGMSADLTSLFECPVCFDYVLPPILQCSSGHLVCVSCRSKLTCCPTCRGPLANIRNLAMEKVASNVKFPCKHSGYGCTASLVYTEKTEHEETCECRPYLCPCPGASCKWQGPLDLVMQHLMMSHKSITTLQVASNVKFPCKHSGYGCTASLVYTEKTEHEETCECRPYLCPCPGASCKWQGPLDLVMQHLMMSHKSITTLQGEDIVFLATDINLPGAVDWVMMQSCFGHHFMLVLEKQEKYDGHQQFFAIVQLIGSRKEAENFVYRLELNGNRRRLTWEAMPRSIHEGVASAIHNSDCLVFDTSIAQLFADNGNLGINVTISLV
ncbi:GD14671 [Drosophila simulans]|uniref:E3 ubiquitin-protein ligase n=1 Tax=Drosophila simulans TaxID=7240 RepID=B4QNB8_DROSI|nr:GD14671 [Drosophila simulans]